ncbi:EamA family transporter [Natronorubrum sp. DTA28]|uniref:EamA family transporter n=1 Tax=Natronorubrum sp. DTA28 TaxID=3447019 RepID=UPI003F826A91
MSRYAVSLAVVAMLSWGVWTVIANEATRTIDPELAMILSYSAAVAVAVCYVSVVNDPVSIERTGVLLALAAGVFAGIGAVAFYVGLNAGRAGIVTTVSAMYFIVAVILAAVFLGESLAPTDLLGIAFAILAVALLAS